MNVETDTMQAQFRQEFRTWLRRDTTQQILQAAHTDHGDIPHRFELHHRWHRALHKGGWMGITWPRKHGGRSLPLSYQFIVNEELAAAAAPPIAAWVSVDLAGPVIMKWGTAAQQRLLPKILSGDLIACQAFSEEQAGSDLSAVATRATKVDGGWRLCGTKIWTSWAQFADVALVVARTNLQVRRHHGMSCFLIDMTDPGLTIEPIRMLHGGAEEDRLHLHDVTAGDDTLVGEEGDGWPIVMHSLGLARGISTLSRTASLEVDLAQVVERLRRESLEKLRAKGLIQRVAHLQTRLRALRWLAYHLVSDADDAQPGDRASTGKLQWATLSADVARLALEVGGLDALGEPPDWDTQTAGAERFQYLRALGNSIEGGSNEIQREILASRVLGLGA